MTVPIALARIVRQTLRGHDVAANLSGLATPSPTAIAYTSAHRPPSPSCRTGK
jgi:hypothetical protein